MVSRGRLGREWPHAILNNRARQIDRVARQGGEGVQDALYMSEGACPADLAIRTPLGKWPLKYVNMLRVIWGYTHNSSSETTEMSPLACIGRRTFDDEGPRKLVIATLCKANLCFLPCTIIVAGDRRERSWATGTWQTYLIADDQPPCEIAAAVHGIS